MIFAPGPSVRLALVAAGSVLALSACTTGSADNPVPTPSSSTVQPTAVPPEPPSVLTDLQELLDGGGVSDADIGFDRQLESAADYGLDFPTLALCGDVDPSDAQRVDRVQHWWDSPGWAAGEAASVVVSVELVVYSAGGGEAAVAALQQTPTICPERTLDDGRTIVFENAEPPPSALPGSAAVRSRVITPTGDELQQVTVAQRIGDLVGLLYVTGVDATATTEAARVSAILATRLTDLAAKLEPGTDA